MEPTVLPTEVVAPASLPRKPWATDGAKGRPRNIINSLYINPPDLERVNLRLQQRYDEMARHELRFEGEHLDDAEIVIIAYGTAARVAVTAIERARSNGIRAGLMRPVSLFPFPTEAIAALAGQVRAILVVELSLGQLVEDVRLAVEGRCPVHLLGRTGGVVMTPAEVLEAVQKLADEMAV
jgi:2-oxoglutarate ferredoxin oxidoreductase subunit alpha